MKQLRSAEFGKRSGKNNKDAGYLMLDKNLAYHVIAKAKPVAISLKIIDCFGIAPLAMTENAECGMFIKHETRNLQLDTGFWIHYD